MQNIIGNIIGNSSAGHMSGGGFPNVYSLLLDGVDEYVNIGRILAIDGASEFSTSFWIKFDVSSSGVNTSIFGRLWNANLAYKIGKNTLDQITFGMGDGSSNGTVGTIITTSMGSWIHIVCVFDGSLTGDQNRAKIYINGQLETTTTKAGTIPTTIATHTNHLYFGRFSSTTVAYVNGNYDELGLFDYALSATQVTDLYNSGVPTDLMSTSGVTAPIHYYRNGDTSGDDDTIINDIGSTGGNDGTPVNIEAGDFVEDAP